MLFSPQGAQSGLRPLPPDGQISVSKEALMAVRNMGFQEADAAIALHQAWGDVAGAVAVLLGEAQKHSTLQK